MKSACMVLAFTLLVAAAAYAQLKVIGSGSGMGIDTSGFPPEMREAYSLMERKCTLCHTIERIIISVQTGVCPITNIKFDKETSRSVVTRMFAKPDSNLSREEALTILKLLNYLLDLKTNVAEEAK